MVYILLIINWKTLLWTLFLTYICENNIILKLMFPIQIIGNKWCFPIITNVYIVVNIIMLL